MGRRTRKSTTYRTKVVAEVPICGRGATSKAGVAFDPAYQPAKLQLCQDLLRLGEEAEGWKLAAEIFSKDGYNVVAYNLVTLRDRLSEFPHARGRWARSAHGHS